MQDKTVCKLEFKKIQTGKYLHSSSRFEQKAKYIYKKDDSHLPCCSNMNTTTLIKSKKEKSIMLLSKDAQYINWHACLLDVYPQEERNAVRGKRADCGVSQKVLRLSRHLQPTTPSSPISLFGSACQAVLHNAKNRCLTRLIVCECQWERERERLYSLFG